MLWIPCDCHVHVTVSARVCARNPNELFSDRTKGKSFQIVTLSVRSVRLSVYWEPLESRCSRKGRNSCSLSLVIWLSHRQECRADYWLYCAELWTEGWNKSWEHSKNSHTSRKHMVKYINLINLLYLLFVFKRQTKKLWQTVTFATSCKS